MNPTPCRAARRRGARGQDEAGSAGLVDLPVVVFGDLAGDADLFDEQVSVAVADDDAGAGVDSDLLVTGGGEEEPGIMPYLLVALDAQAHDLDAVRLCAFADEGD